MFASVKAIKMNQQALTNYHISVTAGATFTDQDFINQGNDPVPVLMGSEYANVYKIGDVLEADYLRKPFRFYVKGFVKEKSLIINSTNPETYLDRYIIMPAQNFVNFPLTEEDLAFQQKHYLQLINRDIFSIENAFKVREEVEAVKASSDFFQTQLLGANSGIYNLVFSALHVNRVLLVILFIVFLIVTFVSMSIYFSNKIDENQKNYCVHLVAGATVVNIFYYHMAELLFIIVLPLIICISVYMSFIDVDFLNYMLSMTSLFLSMLLIIVCMILLKLKKLSISMMLKRTE